MARIRGLIVDDVPRLIEFMKSRLGRELGWDIGWEIATNVDEALQKLAISPRPFELVVADLLYVREDVPDLDDPAGLDLISDASQRSPRTFILAISSGGKYFPDLMEEAKRRGAHHVVRRSEFSTASQHHSPAAIAAEIREHLLDNGAVTTCRVAADPLDPGVQGLLHQVGESTIARLYCKILEDGGHEAEQIHVSFLTPGASGASVCTVTAHIDGVGRMSHILKLSRAKDALTLEVQRGQRAAEVLRPSLLVQHRPARTVGPVNGWYALGGPLVERASTLRGWLSEGPSPTVVADVLEALFIEGLGPVYAEGKSKSVEPLETFVFPPHQQRLILQALGELKEALERPDGGNLANEAAVIDQHLNAFVTERRLPGLLKSAIPQHTYLSYSHGDLHGGNVLVCSGRHPLPQLIDPSHFGIAHWAIDPAWLAVDLVMRGVDPGAESMLFTGFNSWRSLVTRFGAGQPDLRAVTRTPATSAALAALSWIATNLHRVTPAMQPDVSQSEYRWEWHAALATHLLRMTYHADIPPPKRAVAFAAAYDQLATAAATIPAHG